jgi:hypothetical protein
LNGQVWLLTSVRCTSMVTKGRTGIEAAQGAVQWTICAQWSVWQSGQSMQCDGAPETVESATIESATIESDWTTVAMEANAGRPVATAARQAKSAESRRIRFIHSSCSDDATLPSRAEPTIS